MLKQNIVFAATKTLVIDIVWDFIYFPVWWYTVGLKHVVMNTLQSILDMSDHLALRLLILNIFKPMFAQTDRAGRVISFFMRIVILIGRSIYFFIFAVLRFLLVIFWVLLPPFVLYRLIDIFIFSYVI